MSGIYVTGNIPLKSGLMIEPLLLFTTSEADSKIDFQFSVGMRYELGMREFSRAASPIRISTLKSTFSGTRER